MTIANYISDLLYRYECVILPGFGAILTHRKPAEVNRGSHTFTPPRKTLSFNRQLTQNDGLLANYIAKTEAIAYDLAVEKIQEYLHFLETEIEEGRNVEIENVGIFKLSSEGKVLFEPSSTTNYLTEAFGLGTYVSTAMQRKYSVSPEIKQIQPAQENSSNTYLKYAAIGVLAIGLAGFGGFFIHSNQVAEHNVVQQQEAEKKIEQKIHQATFLIENPLPAVQLHVTAKPKGNFHLVAGAFRVKENAEQKVEELKQKGFKAREIGANKYGLHQVVYNSYETRSEALRELRVIQESVNSGAWLLVQEL